MDENREAQLDVSEPELAATRQRRPRRVRGLILFIQLVLLGRLSLKLFSQQMGFLPAELPQRYEDSFASISWILFLIRNGSLVAAAIFLTRLRRQAILFLHVEVVFSVFGCFPAVFLAHRTADATAWLWYAWLCGWAAAWIAMQGHLVRLWRAGVLTDSGAGAAGEEPEAPRQVPAWTIHDRISQYSWGGLLFSLWFMALPLVTRSYPGLGHELERLTLPLAIGVGLAMSKRSV